MMKKQLLIALLFICTTIAGFAQTVEFSNIRRMQGRGLGQIISNDELSGYFAFYEVEKEDKKNRVYHIDLTDVNLNKAGGFDIIRPKNTVLIEVTFNGENFMFVFYDKKTGLDYVVIDRSGKELGKYNMKELDKWETMRINAILMQPEVETVSSFGIGKAGFVKLSWVDNKKVGYEIVALDTKGKVLWKNGSPVDSKLLETADILNADENYTLVYVGKKTGAMTKKADFFVKLIDSKTGKTLFENQLQGNAKQDYSMLNAFVETERNSVTVIGELYAPGDEPLKDQSAGLYIQELEMDGSQKNMYSYFWDKEIKKVKNAKMTEEQKDSEKKSALYIHKVIRSKDGTLTLMGEQYKKSASALGIASAVLNQGNSGQSVVDILVLNMVAIQFGSDMTIKDYQLIEKKKSRIALPQGYGTAAPPVLAAYIKAIGGFDYSFTSGDKASDKYTVIYQDLNRKEEDSKEKNDLMLGVVTVNGGAIEKSRIPVNSDGSVWVRAGKPGYVMISEYIRKGKKLKCRLESLKN